MKSNSTSRMAITISLFFAFLLIALPIDLYAQVEDTTPPVLVDFSFSPTTVDVATGAVTVTATSRVTDDISGLSDIIVHFESPSGLHSAGTSESTRVSGTAYDGVYQSVITIQQFAEEGTWVVAFVGLYDEVRNSATYHVDDLEALGFSTELEVMSDPTIDDILFFFDESVENGTLEGDGPGNSANGRLYALRNILEMAGNLINIEDIEGACLQLNAALGKCDGNSPPPDFVTGPADSELYEMIVELMDELECE